MRVGELLKEIKAQRGANQNIRQGDHTKVLTRKDAAATAKLSRHQRDTALQVASIPKEEFERMIEAEEPPTVTQLAERGTKRKPMPLVDLEGRDPAEYRLSRYAQRDIQRMADLALSEKTGRTG